MTGILYLLKDKLSKFWSRVRILLSLQNITQIVTKQLSLELQIMQEKSSDPENPQFKRGDIVFILFSPTTHDWPMLGTSEESDCKVMTSRFVKRSADERTLALRRPELFRGTPMEDHWSYSLIVGRTGSHIGHVPEHLLISAKSRLESLASDKVRLIIDTELAPAGTCFYNQGGGEYYVNEDLGVYLHKSRVEAKQAIFEKY